MLTSHIWCLRKNFIFLSFLSLWTESFWSIYFSVSKWKLILYYWARKCTVHLCNCTVVCCTQPKHTTMTTTQLEISSWTVNMLHLWSLTIICRHEATSGKLNLACFWLSVNGKWKTICKQKQIKGISYSFYGWFNITSTHQSFKVLWKMTQSFYSWNFKRIIFIFDIQAYVCIHEIHLLSIKFPTYFNFGLG